MNRNYDWRAYDASMRNLQKANARRKKLGLYPRPWRSKEESLMIRRLVWWWHTSRDNQKPSCRDWARQLGISHTWVQKLGREFAADPDEVRRLQEYGDPKLEQLDRAREQTRRMRERYELRRPARRGDEGLRIRTRKAVLAYLAGQPHGAITRHIAKAIHFWPRPILRLLRQYERLNLVRGRRRGWRPMVWEITRVAGHGFHGWRSGRPKQLGDFAFPDCGTHNYTKSHGRSPNARKAAAPRIGARGTVADAQKLHHARRVAAAERRAYVPTASRAARDSGGRCVGC